MISEEYSLEYGTDKMEMHVGAVQPGDRALVIDDLIATGGTLSAAVRLLGEFLVLGFKFVNILNTIALLSIFFQKVIVDVAVDSNPIFRSYCVLCECVKAC